MDRIESELRGVRADNARLEAILRVIVGAPRGDVEKALDLGPIPVTYKGSDGKPKKFELGRLRLIE